MNLTSVKASQGVSVWKPILTKISVDKPISTQRIMSAGQFGGPLIPAVYLPEEQQANPKYGYKVFADIMNQRNRHEYRSAEKQLCVFRETYPESPWRQEAMLRASSHRQNHRRDNDQCLGLPEAIYVLTEVAR